MVEEWKDIKDYEGLYQVSNLGRVKKLSGVSKTWNKKDRILKPGKNKFGYLFVGLCKDRKRKYFQVHRLVLTTFSPVSNMDELTVDHVNRIPTDNRLVNLRWATSKEQMYFDDQDFKSHAKKVLQFTKNGQFVKEFESAYEIKRELGYLQSHISQCCNGKRKTAYGYIWSFDNLNKYNEIKLF